MNWAGYLIGYTIKEYPEEIKAMEAGLAPGMVRKGLRLMGEFVMCLESFMRSLEMKTVTIGAFYYHNAILWRDMDSPTSKAER